MLETAQNLIKRAGKKLGFSEEEITRLLQADAEHKFEIKLDSGKKLRAFRVQHNSSRGPYKGGIRFHDEVNLDEVRALATLMSLKTAVIGLPLGGGKGGVVMNPKEFDDNELEEISRKYVQGLHQHIGPDTDVPAPDVNTNATIIDWMVDEYEQLTGDDSKASFTGKSIKNGGSLGRDAATGRGGVVALAELLKHEGKQDEPLTIAIQGYGNVGAFFATVAEKEYPHWRVVAGSDSDTVVYNKNGLDVVALATYKTERGRFRDYAKDVEHITNEELLALGVDVLVLAALGDAVTEENMESVHAKYILELANGPVNEAAHDYLTKHNVTIVPDIIANAGGVIVSYLEWLQNKQDEHWSEDTVNQKLQEYMANAVADLMETAQNEEQASLTEAAFMLALKRLTS